MITINDDRIIIYRRRMYDLCGEMTIQRNHQNHCLRRRNKDEWGVSYYEQRISI
ncbi:hypothetical protein HUZ99_09555 [Staphylococcus sp. SS87]|nr:hypothetical protein [Staphylococcus singaporensis]UMT74779.1 hypothetical protein ML435_07670 [Staphylococcus roterodami]MBE5664502.1 hypothetical protein [Staphylococcus singaporensis]MBE5667372.1 hypothetical protein [Staphylococcus singaporensis]MBE5676666.1 hypothetical protein [Staphylococcus singaporensis]